MKRSQFIQNMLALGGLQVLPQNLFKSYRKFYLLQFFVAGFRFYEGMNLLGEMNTGDLLELVREPDNEYDECAIALHWNKHKIGFIPRDENAVLSRLIDANALDLIAEITHLNKEVEPWENLHVAVSFLKETEIELPAEMAYLTTLETPRYTAYKTFGDRVLRLDMDNDEEDDEYDDWYEFLVLNSRDDSIYGIIHDSNLKPDYPYGKDTGEFLLVNKKRLPPEQAVNELVKEAEQKMGELNDVFGEDGYIVMSVKEAESLVGKVERLADVADKFGQHYIELILK